jgi:hypothetical protein
MIQKWKFRCRYHKTPAASGSTIVVVRQPLFQLANRFLGDVISM